MIKNLFSKDAWMYSWKDNLLFVAWTAGAYIIGAFGGAMIQAMRDALK